MYPTEIIGKEFIPYYGIKEIIQVQFSNIAFKIFMLFFFFLINLLTSDNKIT
jgi:hypothetical protein